MVQYAVLGEYGHIKKGKCPCSQLAALIMQTDYNKLTSCWVRDLHHCFDLDCLLMDQQSVNQHRLQE